MSAGFLWLDQFQHIVGGCSVWQRCPQFQRCWRVRKLQPAAASARYGVRAVMLLMKYGVRTRNVAERAGFKSFLIAPWEFRHVSIAH